MSLSSVFVCVCVPMRETEHNFQTKKKTSYTHTKNIFPSQNMNKKKK